MPKYILHYLCRNDRTAYHPGEYDDLPNAIKSNSNLVSVVETPQTDNVTPVKQSVGEQEQIKPKELSTTKKEKIDDTGTISRAD